MSDSSRPAAQSACPAERESVPCNLCGGRDHALWAQAGAAQVVRCRRCGLVFTSPRPTREALAAAYEAEYGQAHEEEGLVAARRRMYEREKREIIRRASGILTPTPLPRASCSGEGNDDGNAGGRPRLLDVGCGTGEFLSMLAQDFEVYGTDVSRRYIALARERYGLPHLVAAELHEAGFADGFFHVVQMRGVLQHLPDPLGQLHEAFRITRPGGLLIISATPNIESLAARVFRGNFRLLAPDLMVYDFSPRTLRAMVEKAGWRVEEFNFP